MMSDYKFKLGLSVAREEGLKKKLERLASASKNMLQVAGLASQGSRAYNRAIINLHEAVEDCLSIPVGGADQ